jgi:hypothetical protein
MNFVIFFSTVGIVVIAYSIWNIIEMRHQVSKKYETNKQRLRKIIEQEDLAGKDIEEVKALLGEPSYIGNTGGNPALYYWEPPDYFIEIMFKKDGKFLKLQNHSDKHLTESSN